MKQYGPNNGVNRVVVTGADFGLIRARMLSKPGQVTQDVAEALREIAGQGVRDMRQSVITSTTKTGRARAALGQGEPGRIVTGKMLNSIDQKITVNKNSVTMNFGWLNGRPGYAFFQEYGTSNGVPAMHALTDAQVKARIELRRVLKDL